MLEAFGVFNQVPFMFWLINLKNCAYLGGKLDKFWGSLAQLVTELKTDNQGCDCVVALDCLVDIIRTLRMGSCLSYESKSPLPGFPAASMGIRKRKNLKRRGSPNSSFDLRREEMLHRVTGRMFLNDAIEVGSLFTQQGKKGINQDAMIVWENFGSRPDTVFCGVFDGHGPYGHLVSKRVRDSLPLKLSANWETNVYGKSENLSVVSVKSELKSSSVNVEEEAEKQPEIFQKLRESFAKAFMNMDKELELSTNIDCFCSGTTAVTLVKQGSDIVIRNVGDSRAILATRDEDNSLNPVQLTVDLKPSIPAEAERIRKCKGRIFALQDEPEVARVWLPKYDTPGLAMARAFGDFCLKDYGVISKPEISCRRLSEKDEFIVLATDGIWDVLSNKQVVDIVASFLRPMAARKLVESAVEAWRSKYPTSRIEDCAVVCLFLDPTSNGLSSTSTAKFKDPIGLKFEKEDDQTAIISGLSRSGTVKSDKSLLFEEENHGEAEEENTASDTI